MKLQKRIKKNVRRALPALLSPALCGYGNAAAQEPPAWKFETIMYGWYTDIGSTMRLPGPGGIEDSMTIDATDIIDNLKFTFMGTFVAHYDRWSLLTDVIYLNVGDDAAATVMVGPEPGRPVNASASLDISSWVVNAGVGYDLVKADWGNLTLLGGARYISLSIDGTFDTGVPAERNRSHSDDLWNGIAGCKGFFNLSENWFLPYYVDFGTGDSDFTTQLFAGLGYRFSWGDIRMGYRYVYFEQDSDAVVADLDISGPVAGVAFQF